MDYYRVVQSARGGGSINSVLKQSSEVEAQADWRRKSLHFLFYIILQVWMMISY